MARYIDEDWLLAEANMDGAYGYVGADQIAKAPTACVVEVVRCKNCKFHTYEEPGMVYCPINIVGGWVEEDFFCANGEMKENDSVK